MVMKRLEKTALMKNELNAIETAVERLKKDYPMDRVVLFGSKARGDSDEYSDIDLLIITTRNLHWKEEKDIIELLFDIGMDYDVIFSPFFATNSEWDGDLFSEFPIYQEILKDGAVVA